MRTKLNRSIYIYGLIDPRTAEVRYIGKSVRPNSRLHDHCVDSATTWRTNWLRELKRCGDHPEIRIFQKLRHDADCQSAERQWIAFGRKQGWPLTNCTDGGDGVPNLPLEIRARMRLTWLGRKHRPESLEKISAASRGRRHSDSHRAHMRAIMTGRQFTSEWLEKIRRANQKLTDAQIAEIRILLAARVSQYAIADRFGVHQGTISNIKRGVSYAGVGEAAVA